MELPFRVFQNMCVDISEFRKDMGLDKTSLDPDDLIKVPVHQLIKEGIINNQ